MDDKTRGVGPDDELRGRSEESTRSYAVEPGRPTPTVSSRGSSDVAPSTSRRSDALDDESERRARELQGEIAHTRAEMSETIDALQEKLRPGRIASDAGQRVKTATTEKARDMADMATDTAQGVVETARQNPIPALMIGAGVAWMLIDRSRSGETDGRWRSSSPRRYEGFGEVRRGYRLEEDDYLDEPGASGARVNTEAVSAWARETGREARYKARRAQNGLQRLMRENPLLVGAAAMLVGAAVGAALPETERENELMGETRDSVVDKAQNAAQNAVTAAKDAANDVVGDTVGKVAEKVASSTKQS